MSVVHDYSAWALQAILAPVTTYESSFALAIVVIHAVVVLVQHGEILRVRLSAIFVCFHVVRLAAVGRDVAVWPWADEMILHGEDALLIGCEPGFVKIDRALGGVESPT